METPEYKELFSAGVDGIAVYQETYDRARYAQVHLSGYKKDYDFRYATPHRAAEAGMRQISLGVLLGLSDPLQDLFALYQHLRELERSFPGVEYSVSFPRLRTVKSTTLASCDIDDVLFVKTHCLNKDPISQGRDQSLHPGEEPQLARPSSGNRHHPYLRRFQHFRVAATPLA